MDNHLIELINELNKELVQHPLVVAVKEAEKEMEENEEFIRRVVRFQNATTNYNDAIKLKLPLDELQKELYESKFELDTLDVVKNYRKKYKEAQEYLDKISKQIFANVSKKLKVNEIL